MATKVGVYDGVLWVQANGNSDMHFPIRNVLFWTVDEAREVTPR